MNKPRLSIYLLWVAIIIVFILQIIRVEPLIIWSSETYMGIFVALMGIAVAVIIGYQAISANEIKNEIKEFKSQLESLKISNKDFENKVQSEINSFIKKINSEVISLTNRISELETHSNNILSSTQESVAILNALILENKYKGLPDVYFYAFEKMTEALFYGLNYESKNIDFIFYKLRQYGGEIETKSFGTGFCSKKDGLYYITEPYVGKSLKEITEIHFLPPIKNFEEKIRSHENFRSISHDYNKLMEQFYKRIEVCTSRIYPKDSSEEYHPFS